MQVDNIRFWVGMGTALVGIGFPFTGAPVPHVVGWLIVLIGFAIMFWPVIRHPKMPKGLWPFGRITLHDAAQCAYEAAERDVVLELMGHTKDPGTALDHFKYVFMVDDEADFRGVKLPSTVPLKIPFGELRGNLMPITGTSDLAFPTSSKRPVYANVTVRMADLRRVVRQYPKQVRADLARFRNP